MSIRSDLLIACIMGNRWRASSTPAAGTTVSAQSPIPSNYDSRVHLETIWYSINNLSAAGVTVSVQVKSASQAGTVLASIAHYVPTLGSANAALPQYQFVGKRGLGLVVTMDTVVASVVQAINTAGWIEDATTSGGTYDSTYIRSLAPKAWFRFNVGNTVSQWTDQSGNANHLLQGTVAAQPTIATDGSYVFDGVGQYMKCTAFTLNQPETIYILGKQITWTLNDCWTDGNGARGLQIVQTNTTPKVSMDAGATVLGPSTLALDAYGVIAAVFNGTASMIQVNSGAPVTGDGGSNNAGGFNLATNGIATTFANIQVKEVVIFADAHDAPTRARVISYLKTVGQLSF